LLYSMTLVFVGFATLLAAICFGSYGGVALCIYVFVQFSTLDHWSGWRGQGWLEILMHLPQRVDSLPRDGYMSRYSMTIGCFSSCKGIIIVRDMLLQGGHWKGNFAEGCINFWTSSTKHKTLLPIVFVCILWSGERHHQVLLFVYS